MEPRATAGLPADQWRAKLAMIASLLATDTSLCLMGSACNMFEGMDSRTSIDLDVWLRKSILDRDDLRVAADAVGLGFDYQGLDEEPDRPYIQLVKPGIASPGRFAATEQLLPTQDRLAVTRPPIAHLVAAKMARMEPKDVEDVSFLLNRHPEVTVDAVARAIETLPPDLRETATENMVYLPVLRPSLAASPTR
jgi:hypothetical protein